MEQPANDLQYTQKDKTYFKHIRLGLLEFIKDEKDLTILDIGGGGGETLLHLKNLGVAKSIHLFDIVDKVSDKDLFDSVTIGDIMTTDLFDESYDIIIMSDVIEHLFEPQVMIEKAKRKLKDNGRSLVSIPNIQFIKAMYKVFIKGSFKYEESGVFDRTHMRFYCQPDMLELFKNHNDLEVLNMVSVNKYNNFKISILDKLTLGLFTKWLSMQFLMEIKKIETV